MVSMDALSLTWIIGAQFRSHEHSRREGWLASSFLLRLITTLKTFFCGSRTDCAMVIEGG